jgi:hypothetical protein
MKLDRVNRRSFLVGSGVSLAVPLLPSLFASSAVAGPAANKPNPAKPRRFIAVKSYSTQRVVDWYPRFSGGDYKTRPFDPKVPKADGSTIANRRLEVSSGRHSDGREYYGSWAPLSELARGGSVSNILGPKFNPFLSKLSLLRGMDFMPECNHNDGGMLGNYAGSIVRFPKIDHWPTIDQVLAFSKKVYPTSPIGPRSLHLSMGNRNTCSFTDNGIKGSPVVQVQAHTNPLTAFRDVFGAVDPKTRAESKKLVDLVLEDYRDLRDEPALSSDDRHTLETHMTFLSEVEQRLNAVPRADCKAPNEPQSIELTGIEANDVLVAKDLMVDIALAAIRCDVTRVVTFDVYKAIGPKMGANGEDLGYVHSGVKDPRDWHERAHEFGRPESDRQVRAINQWIADEVVGKFLAALDVQEDAGETYLDRSVLFWGNEIAENHSNWSVPALLAGSAGGALRTGRYLDYIDWERPAKYQLEDAPIVEGVPHNRLLVALLQAFGLTKAEYERPTQAGYGSYRTDGKDPNVHAIDYDEKQFGEPVPGLLT